VSQSPCSRSAFYGFDRYILDLFFGFLRLLLQVFNLRSLAADGVLKSFDLMVGQAPLGFEHLLLGSMILYDLVQRGCGYVDIMEALQFLCLQSNGFSNRGKPLHLGDQFSGLGPIIAGQRGSGMAFCLAQKRMLSLAHMYSPKGVMQNG